MLKRIEPPREGDIVTPALYAAELVGEVVPVNEPVELPLPLLLGVDVVEAVLFALSKTELISAHSLQAE